MAIHKREKCEQRSLLNSMCLIFCIFIYLIYKYIVVLSKRKMYKFYNCFVWLLLCDTPNNIDVIFGYILPQVWMESDKASVFTRPSRRNKAVIPTRWPHVSRRHSDPKLWPNTGSILGQRRRRWSNMESGLGQRRALTGRNAILLNTERY